MKTLFLIPLLFVSCASLNPIGEVIKTDKGIILKLNVQGKIAYKDGDIEAEMDTRTSSLLRTLVEGSVIQGMNQRK